MTKRVQLQRSPGWCKPPGAVVVARPSQWGNPFTLEEALRDWGLVSEDEAREAVVAAFREWLDGQRPGLYDERRAVLLRDLPRLAGHDLACWCSLDRPCHADVLLELANELLELAPPAGPARTRATVTSAARLRIPSPSEPDAWAGTSATGYGATVRAHARARGITPAGYIHGQ
jgi:hypothetical protein